MQLLHAYLASSQQSSGLESSPSSNSIDSNATNIAPVETPFEAISALESLLREGPSLRFTTNPTGRCFYSDIGSESLQFG
jgi:hypothetical protein